MVGNKDDSLRGWGWERKKQKGIHWTQDRSGCRGFVTGALRNIVYLMPVYYNVNEKQYIHPSVTKNKIKEIHGEGNWMKMPTKIIF